MPANRNRLSLHEELALLALRDERGTLESRAGWHTLALGGALLAELLLTQRVTLDADRKALVRAGSAEPRVRAGESPPDALPDECLALIRDARRARAATSWVARFGRIRRLRHRVAIGLCENGVLRDSEETILLIFKRKSYPTINPGPEQAMNQRLRDAVMNDSPVGDARTLMLVAIAHAAGMLRIRFTRAELKSRKARLKTLCEDPRCASVYKAVKGAVEAAAAAAAAAAV
ncbi:MAG: GPP34 family phosphoprotein [Phycisphaerae bacterium]